MSTEDGGNLSSDVPSLSTTESKGSTETPLTDTTSTMFPPPPPPTKPKITLSFSTDSSRITSSSLASGIPSQTAPRARKKVPLAPGHSMLDWRRYCQSLPRPEDFRTYSLSEIAQHNTETDAWIVINQRVYNVTDYLPYHPGGVSEIMKGAGIDATVLFNEAHSFVNVEMMLEKHFIGVVSKTKT